MKEPDAMDSRQELPQIPEALAVNFDKIPPELQLYPAVVWKYQIIDGDVKKPPYNPRTGRRASVADPSTWGSFHDAREAYLTGKWGKMDGIGIMLVEGGGLVAIDIDDCIQEGSLLPHALHIISMFDTYTEFSPSIPRGATLPTGIHLWVRGEMPGLFCRNDDLHVEIYGRRRYMTVTGHPLHRSGSSLQADQNRLAAVYNEIFAYTGPTPKGTGGGHIRSRRATLATSQTKKH